MPTWRVGNVVLTARQGVGARGATVGDPPPPAGDSPHLTPGTAQGDFSVSALTYVHQITKVGDPDWTTSTWSAPQRGPSAMYQKGVQFERVWGFVFDEPGTYQIISTAIDPSTGTRATSSVYEYVVNDPNTVFSSAQTFVVAFDSNYTGAPANAGTFNSIDGARQAINGSGLPRARILLKRGTTSGTGFNTNSHRSDMNSVASIYYGTWGSGALPVLQGGLLHNLPNLSSGRRAYRMVGWRWESTWNQATATGSTPELQLLDETNTEWCITGCEISGNSGFSVATFKGIAFCNNTFDNIFQCYCLGGGNTSDYGLIIGNRGYDPIDGFVMANGSQSGGFGFRLSDTVVLSQASQNDFFKSMSNNFSGSSSPAQSPLRLVVQTSTGGAYVNVDRNVIETGGGIGFGSGSAGTPLVPTTGNLRSNIFINSRDGACFGPTHTGWLMENCIWIKPPIRHSTWNGSGAAPSASRFIELGNGSSSGQVGDARNNPMYTRNNTFVYLGDGTTPAIFADASYSGSWTHNPLNNLVHAPFASSGAADRGPFESGAVTVVRNAGFRTNISPVQTSVEPRTVTPTHYVDLTSASGTFSEGSAGSPVTVSASGLTGAKIAQVHGSGGTRRLWLYDVVGSIANGVTVTLSSGGTGTANGAMVEANIAQPYVPTSPPSPDSGPFARLTFLGKLNTTARVGAVIDA
jgi:hypothetical protein